MDVRGTFVVNGPHIPVCCLAKGAEVFLARVKIAGDQALLISHLRSAAFGVREVRSGSKAVVSASNRSVHALSGIPRR